MQSSIFWGLMLTVLSAATRLTRLGRQSFWLDECSTVCDLQHPWNTIHRVVTGSPPLFFYVVKVLYGYCGRNDFWLRTAPAFFGLITIPIFFRLLRRRFSAGAACAAAVFLCLSPFHIAYSQELRMYTLATLESLLATYFFMEAIATSERRPWIFFAAAVIAGVYTHYWFVFLIASYVLYFAWDTFDGHRVDPMGLAMFATIALAVAPWLQWAVLHQPQPGFENLTAPTWHQAAEAFYALAGLRVTVGDASLQIPLFFLPIFAFIAGTVLTLGLFAPGPRRNYVIGFFMVGCALPLLLAFFTSRWIKPVFLPSRYTLLLLPAFLVPIARAVEVSDNRIRRAVYVAISVWFMGSASLLPTYYQRFDKAEWKYIGALITQQAHPGDAVLLGALGYASIAADYYIPLSLPRLNDLRLPTPSKSVFVLTYNNPSGDDPRLGPRLTSLWQIKDVYRFQHMDVLKLVANRLGHD